jgi:hypothetical protein
VMNWARKPGWRIAANDRFLDDGWLPGTDFGSLIKNHQFAARRVTSGSVLHGMCSNRFDTLRQMT